jgi:hypothetical protein
MLGYVVISFIPISLIILPVVAYFAVKNDWKITKYF